MIQCQKSDEKMYSIGTGFVRVHEPEVSMQKADELVTSIMKGAPEARLLYFAESERYLRKFNSIFNIIEILYQATLSPFWVLSSDLESRALPLAP